MKSKNAVRVVLASLFCTAFLSSPVYSAEASGKDYAVLPATAKIEQYNTQLFNLVDKNSVMAGKKFDKDFAARFDKLLQASHVANGPGELKFLKKRLLSGPAPEPVYVTASGKQYLYYESCQAHACDETYLSLLFDVDTKVMSGRLVDSGKSSVLGTPSAQELKLLGQLRSAD